MIAAYDRDAEWHMKVVRTVIQDALYASLLSCIVVMSFYSYLQAFFPLTPYVKDIILLAASFFSFLNVMISAKKGRQNFPDVLITALFAYLVFQIFYTADIIHSPEGAYYGFRLTFLPVVLYFGFRNVRSPERQKKIHTLVFCMLVFGVFATLMEFFGVSLHIIPREFIFKISASKIETELKQSGFFRTVGMAGSPHITGVYNLILFALMLFIGKSGNAKSKAVHAGNTSGLDFPVNRKNHNMLLVMSFLAVVFSTSRTAWTVLIPVCLLYIVSDISARKLLSIAIRVLVVVAFVGYLWSQIKRLEDFETYVGFLEVFTDLAKQLFMPILQESPFIGFGYEVGVTAPVDVDKIRWQNIETSVDFFFIQIFKMLGMIGLGMFVVLFIVFPLFVVFGRKFSSNVRGVALAIFSVGLSFGHYNPLQSPPVAVVVWYLFAYISTELSMQKKVRGKYG